MLPSNFHQEQEPPTPLSTDSNSTPWTEDLDWWENAEEIDLTANIPPEEGIDFLLQDDYPLFNESTFLDLDCDDFITLPAPPSLEYIPPPPLPPFLEGMGDILQESFRRWHRRNTVDFYQPEDNDLYRKKLEWVSFEENKCSICDWANGGNETLELLAKKQGLYFSAAISHESV